MKLIYLHGFASIGNSSKSSWLREHLADDDFEFSAPDLPNRTHDAALFLDAYFADLKGERVGLIGTSLGGFFAAYYGALFGWPTVLINPLADVTDLTGSAMGENKNYYSDETFIMNQSDADCLHRLSAEIHQATAPSLLLLDRGDDVLDYNKAIARFGPTSDIHLFENGSHRFDHLPESLAAIRALFTE